VGTRNEKSSARGAVFLATEEDSKNGFLRTIWEKHEHEIMSSFKRGEVKYSIVAAELPKISVQVWYDPISDLIGSSSDEKKAYGDLLYAKFHRFSEMVDGYLWDIKKMSN
jgi:hypothetical protein